jgi:molecular chaperone Hsp33
MPGASSREIKLVEDNLNELSSLAATVRHDSDPTRLLGHLFNDMIFTILEERILTFECNCSKDRVMRALKLVGKDELSDMIAKDGGASVHCDFCGTHYNFSVAELAAVIRELT